MLSWFACLFSVLLSRYYYYPVFFYSSNMSYMNMLFSDFFFQRCQDNIFGYAYYLWLYKYMVAHKFIKTNENSYRWNRIMNWKRFSIWIRVHHPFYFHIFKSVAANRNVPGSVFRCENCSKSVDHIEYEHNTISLLIWG